MGPLGWIILAVLVIAAIWLSRYFAVVKPARERAAARARQEQKTANQARVPTRQPPERR